MKRLILVLLISSCALAQSTNIPYFGVTYTTVQAAAPTVDNGTNTYNNDVTITVTNVPSGGSACYTYTTDGSTPADPTAATAGTCDDNTYNGASKPVVTATGTKYKFLNTKAGETNSTVSGPFTYTLTVAVPTPSTASGYSGAALTGFTLTPNTTSASTVYTVDGTTTPNCSGTGTTYSGPFDITTTTTLKDIGCKSNYNPSSVTTRTYTISAASVAVDTANVKKWEAQHFLQGGTTLASFTVGGSSNVVMLACTTLYSSAPLATAATFNGSSMTELYSYSTSNPTAKIWYITNQSAGTHDFVVSANTATATYGACKAWTFTGVNTSGGASTFGTPVANTALSVASGATATASAVTSATSDAVLSCFFMTAGYVTTASPNNTGGVAIGTQASDASYEGAGLHCSTTPGAASVTPSWLSGSSGNTYQLISVDVKHQ